MTTMVKPMRFSSIFKKALVPIILSTLSALCTPTSADDWPKQGLKFVVPFPAGGSNDIAARVVGDVLRTRLGQSITVENKPGANGALGVENMLANAKDNHTFLVASDSVSLLPLFRPNMKWDLAKTFTPVAVLVYQPIVLVASPSSGIRNVKDLLVLAKAKPGQVPYATSGQGSIQHLVGELAAGSLGIDLLHVPYKGGGQAVIDVMSGQVPLAVLGAAAVLPHIKSGKLIALAVSTKTRSAMLPSVPTLAESGAGEIDVPQWAALFAPIGFDEAALLKFRAAVTASLAEPATKEKLQQASMEIAQTTPEDFRKQLIRDRDRWAKLIVDRKINLE
jgi:tripartite-type tricarboxylate transporter receptor subunit TctC